jgi:hypothetical protein
MSRSKNQHDTGWDMPNRLLKQSTKRKRRAAEKRFLDKLRGDPESIFENEVIEKDEELDDIYYWD